MARRDVVSQVRLSTLAVLLPIAACSPQGGSTAQNAEQPTPKEGAVGSVPLGDVAGIAQSVVAATVTNPFEGQPQAVAEGHQLFNQMNCADCHGYDGTGGMGPNLTDKSWRYGGTPAAIYNSISAGRPQGMPAWGKALPASERWKLVAFVQSLGGSFPASFYHASLKGDRQDSLVSAHADGIDMPPGTPTSEASAISAPAPSVPPTENKAPELSSPSAPPADKSVQPLNPSPSQTNAVAPTPPGKSQPPNPPSQGTQQPQTGAAPAPAGGSKP